MYVNRYEPWTLPQDLLKEFSRHFERSNGDASSAATADWAPAVDIEEYADKFVLHADVPGIEPKSIEVTLEKGVLTVAGAREKSVEKDGVESRRIERATGRFLRRFVLPDTADSDGVSASNKHGVLEITIPKRAQAQPRRIAVTH
ncbi:MAG TPA: Hsp20/alpha crystallin family protein [Solimonas sp.]|nr:Hsp20/alpha crystallin family protein [Solimonas sp.]